MMPKKSVEKQDEQFYRITGKGPAGLRRLFGRMQKKNPKGLELMQDLMELGTALVSPDGQAAHRISLNRYFYEEESPANILYAIDSLRLAKKHGLDTPVWAREVLESCYDDILNIQAKQKYAGSAIQKALKIKDARSFRRFQERSKLLDAYFEVKRLVKNGKSLTAAREMVAENHPELGTADTLRNKLNRLEKVFSTDKPLPSPFGP